MIIKLFKAIKKCQTGQTSIEYILLISVVITMLIGVSKQIESYLLADAGNCKADSKSIVCRLENAFKFGGGDGKGFRYFTLRR